MAGIVKLHSEQVSSFDTVETTQKLAHRFFVTLRPVDNVSYSGTEFSTFNPFVVGSTPAGPTKFKALCIEVQSAFFMRVPSVEPPESDLHFVWVQFSLRLCPERLQTESRSPNRPIVQRPTIGAPWQRV